MKVRRSDSEDSGTSSDESGSESGNNSDTGVSGGLFARLDVKKPKR